MIRTLTFRGTGHSPVDRMGESVLASAGVGVNYRLDKPGEPFPYHIQDQPITRSAIT